MGNKAKKFMRAEEPSNDDDEFMSDEEMLSDEDVMEGDDEEEEPSGEELSEDADAQQQPKKKKGSQRPEREPIYDTEGLHEKLEDIGWTEEVAWEETQAITHDDSTQIENVDDDIARELAFYNQALSAAQQAIAKFDSQGIPWLRPPDYYAEMVKSDTHMSKVKEQLMFEQKSIEQAEERRKAREAKQYSKQVQAEKQKERTANKKKQIEGVSKLRKQREKQGFAGDIDYDAELAAMDQRQRRPQGFKDRGGPEKQVSKKRQARDGKYGFGGSKKLRKQNDSYSAAAVDTFKQGRFKENFAGKGGKGKPGGVKKQPMKRPGKAARASGRGGGGGGGGKKGGRR